jgi:hypothetical protein
MAKQPQQKDPRDSASQERWRPVRLFAAALLAVGVGAAYAVAWLRGLRGLELLNFTTLYLCLPMGVSLLLLFAALRRPRL